MYTKSKDSEMRTNLHFKIRLSKDELNELNKMAKALDHKNFRDYVDHELFMLIDSIYIKCSKKEID